MEFLVLALCVTFVVATIDWNTVIPIDVGQEVSFSLEALKEDGRITNGQVARPTQFPYQAGLMLHMQKGSGWCGGTLISKQWVLTAAHCTDSIVSVDVYLGAFDRTNRNEQGQQIIFVDKKNIILHEHWNPSAVENDISLIKLPYPVAFNEYIQAAKLPRVNDINISYFGSNAIASGWGRISDIASGSTDKLRWIEVPIMKNSACIAYFGRSVKDTNICINTKGSKSICNGDSGGPLVLADGSNTVIGTTSFGIKIGCEKEWPGVFTRVSSYLDWIGQHSGIVN